MGNLPPLPPSVPTYISSLSKTVKRKPLIFNFKWNFGWILGQHDILVLGDVPPSRIRIFFLSKVRFELAHVPLPPRMRKTFFYPKIDLSWPMYPPSPGLKKKFFKK